MMNMKSIFLTILTFFCIVSLIAQNTAKTDTIMNRELTLEKEYNPTTRDAVKLGQFPELREPQAPKSTVEFSNYAVPYTLQPTLLPLNPQEYLTNLNYSKYKGYLTGGISSLIDINGDLGYQILNSDKDRLNIFLSHRSSNCDISYFQNGFLKMENEKPKFKINDNWGGFNFMHDFNGVNFFADAKYTYSAFNYYGFSIFSPIDLVLPEDIPRYLPNNKFDKNTNQINQMLEAHLCLYSKKSDRLKYEIKAGYTNFQQKYGNTIDENGSKENRFLIDGDIHKLLNSSLGAGVSASFKSYSYTDEIFKSLNKNMTNYQTFSLNPYFYYEEEIINLLVGAKMDIEIGGGKKITLSPAIRFNYFPSNKFLLYIHAEGGRKDNSQYTLFYENRYIDPLIRVMDSRSSLDATAGLKYLPLSTFCINIFGGYKITKDEYFLFSYAGSKNHYNENTPMLAGNWITPIYDDANVIKAGTDFKYTYQNIFELSLKATYYHWTIFAKRYYADAFDHEAWNKPDFEINLNAAYRLPMIPLRFDLSYVGAYGRKGIGFFDPLKMNDIHDLTLKGSYSITPNFSAYLSLNNLLFSKYDFWWGYPAQGFNVVGGLSVLF